MVRPKVPARGPPPRKKANGVVIAVEVETPRPIPHKPHQSENEEVAGSKTPIHTPMLEAEPVKQKCSELRSRVVHDPLELPLAPPTSQAPQVPPIPVHPPRSINRLNVTGLETILMEKRLSKDGVVERYPTIWETLSGSKHTEEIIAQPSTVVDEQGTNAQVEATPATLSSP
uniref:Integrase core domain containing protein n=1 Tax=Solanum tuberosum TaxID=4113 RepID=M1DP81_SOLTU